MLPDMYYHDHDGFHNVHEFVPWISVCPRICVINFKLRMVSVMNIAVPMRLCNRFHTAHGLCHEHPTVHEFVSWISYSLWKLSCILHCPWVCACSSTSSVRQLWWVCVRITIQLFWVCVLNITPSVYVHYLNMFSWRWKILVVVNFSIRWL